MASGLPQGVEIHAPVSPEIANVLSEEALQFVADLHRQFNPRRVELLALRQKVEADIQSGILPDFPTETASIREAQWQVATAPADLADRRTEITGPVDRRMMINALNSGATVFMADLEDSCSPTWENIMQGQVNLIDAVRRNLELTLPDGRHYELNPKIATLLVRPRGWHLDEKHISIDGEAACAAIVDFGLYFFHNGAESLKRGSGPYFYLPKIEHYLEARLWNEIFVAAQDSLGIPQGSIRATVLIETILAAFCMEEILYELKDHSSGLNAGRWDYIFSFIKKFRNRADLVLPDRAQITMTVPFMRAYTELLVKTCHKRGAFAVGGMAAFIPSRKDPTVNEVAIPAVQADKERESGDGFDGTWVAHPDLVPVALEVFDKVLGDKPNQLDRQRYEVEVSAADLLNESVPGGKITEAGIRNNISVGLQYIAHWLGGSGAVAIFNLMEDAATAEISRSQLWQWIRNKAETDEGELVTVELYKRLRDEEMAKIGEIGDGLLEKAAGILDDLILSDDFEEFLTLPAYGLLTANE